MCNCSKTPSTKQKTSDERHILFLQWLDLSILLFIPQHTTKLLFIWEPEVYAKCRVHEPLHTLGLDDVADGL